MEAIESGTLNERPLGALLRDLADRGITGIVHVDGSVKRIICFADGRLYLAMSSPGPSLQRVLIETGGVDETLWRSAIDEAAGHGSIVDALLARGVERDVVEESIRELTLGTLLELLVPDRDEFRIVEGETHQIGTRLTFPVKTMLEEASRRLERWGALEGALPSMTTVLRRNPRLPPGRRGVRLDRVQWRIVDALDEPTDLASLIERTGLGAFAIFEALYHLLDEGAVLTGADGSPADGPSR